MKTRRMLVFVLCLWSINFFTCASAACAENYGTIRGHQLLFVNSPAIHGGTLYEAPDETSKAIERYPNGTTILLPSNSIASVNTAEPCALYSEPSTDSHIEGYYLFGTKVEVEDQDDVWCHVRIGSYSSGYILAKHLESIPDQRIDFVGIPEIGCAVVNLDDSPESRTSIRYQFPDTGSQEMQVGAGITGSVIQIVAVLDEWCQVRSSTDATLGFVQSKELDIYLREDLILEGKEIRLERGVYQVDVDLPSGLYTFHVPRESKGALQIAGTGSALDQTYTMPQGSLYTIYVPPRGTVSILSDGYLTAMENAPIISEENNWEFTCDGRFFIGFETLQHDVWFIITKADESKPAYFQITNLSNIYPYEFEPVTTVLKTDINERVDVPRGGFIEMVNCTISVKFPAG